MSTGILIHGCHLHVADWANVAWGDPSRGMGRIPAGLLQAVTFDASVIVMGTGASFRPFLNPESERSGETLCEAEYSFEHLRMNIDQLLDFHDWRQASRKTDAANDWNALKQRLLARIHLDKTSTNTVSELANAVTAFLEADVDQVIIVTSPTHLVRATRDALSLFRLDPMFNRFQGRFMAVASTTDFRLSSPEDVLVLEPPHRPDRADLDCREYVRRLLNLRSLGPRSHATLLDDLDQLLGLYEEQVEPAIL